MKRTSITAQIIQNSLKKAIQDKDEAYAIRVASFAKSTVSRSSTLANKAYDAKLLEFYETTDDTTKYFSLATDYYDRYFMSVNVDSVKKIDDAMRKRLLDAAKKDTVKTEKGFTLKATIHFSPMAQHYTWDLKEGAWSIYQRTSNPVLLGKATVWMEKALLFFETSEALDVYARLLYKQKHVDQGIEIEKRSIALKKKQGFSVNDNETTLQAMQQGQPLID